MPCPQLTEIAFPMPPADRDGLRPQLTEIGCATDCIQWGLGCLRPTCIGPSLPQPLPPAGPAKLHVQHLVALGVVDHPVVTPLAGGAALEQELAAAAVPDEFGLTEAAAAAGHPAEHREKMGLVGGAAAGNKRTHELMAAVCGRSG